MTSRTRANVLALLVATAVAAKCRIGDYDISTKFEVE
jgi:hypothetical protein